MELATNSLYQNAIDRHLAYPVRKRTISVLSTASTSSSKLLFQKTKTLPATNQARHKAYGSFTPTGSASNSLRLIVKPKKSFLAIFATAHSKAYSLVSHTDGEPNSDEESVASSSLLTPSTLPSISRTSPSSPVPSLTEIFIPLRLDATLAAIEQNSKFCAQSVHCATCGKVGSDYPRCLKCGDMWCSRQCRLKGGKRHLCKWTCS